MALLMMFSMGASADVKIFYGEKGEELKTGETKIKADNGTIAIEQKASDDGSQTTIYLTFTPETGYTISTDNIEVYAVISTGSSPTRTPEISGDPLKLTEETSKSPEKRYSVKIDSNLGLWIKKSEFTKKDDGGSKGNRGGITITTDTNNPVYYLIQSYQNTGFYMRPNSTNVTTLNSVTEEMKWFFLDAGTGTEGSDEVQYYYICDKDGRYMYFSSPDKPSGRVWIELHATRTQSDNNYKFYIVANNTSGYGGYNIIPKGTNTSSPSSLNKQGRNAGPKGIQVGAGLNDEASCWNLIALTDYEWTLQSECFRVSDNTNRYFYKIQSQNNAKYFIKPGNTYVETSNAVDDDMIWYFEAAASDDLMTYYYIRHANTGKYLRYRESTVGNANATELAEHTGSETGDDEARFQFVVARGANADESLDNPKGIIFNIIPKLFINSSANNIRSLSCDKGQGQPLATKEHRSDYTTHWSFVSIYQVETPTITINADNSVTIACATDGATIYYKLGGDDPTTENATQSASIASILPSQGPIKAFAIKDGCIHSDIASESNIPAKTITVSSSNGALTSEDPIVYDGTAHQPAITITDGETTISSEEYSSAYSDNTNAGTATITITDNADGDYNVSGSFTFTITQKPLTITAKDKEITYGDEPANDGVEYDGFIEGEGEDIEGIFTGTLSYAYSYSQYGDVGDTYTITPSGLTATNYAITFNNGTLTVSKKEVEIEWGSTSLGYTGSEQVPTATATNVVNNDEITVTVTGAQTDVGTGYEATVSGLSGPKADNYKLPSGTITTTFEIVKGTFTPTVSIDGWTYGETANTPSVSDNASGGDVTYTYTVKGEDDYSADVPTNAGNYTVQATIAATGNYESVEATTDFTISPKSLGDGKDAATGIDIEMTQDGGNVEVTYVKDGEQTLVVNKDYTVEIQAQGDDNYVIVTGIGNYTGSVQGLFVKPVFTKPTGATEAAAVYQASSDLAKPIDITPYIVIKVNPSIGTIAITPLDYIPEDVPVLLLSDAEAACFVASPKGESTPEITAQTKNSNLLKMAPEGGVEVKAAQKYMFYEGEFVLTKAGTLSAGKFYLYNPNYVATTTPTAQARGVLQLVIEEKTTGINDVRSKMEDVRDCYWYTLEGQRLNSKPTKPGLYIKNGKKTIIKKK